MTLPTWHYWLISSSNLSGLYRIDSNLNFNFACSEPADSSMEKTFRYAIDTDQKKTRLQHVRQSRWHRYTHVPEGSSELIDLFCNIGLQHIIGQPLKRYICNAWLKIYTIFETQHVWRACCGMTGFSHCRIFWSTTWAMATWFFTSCRRDAHAAPRSFPGAWHHWRSSQTTSSDSNWPLGRQKVLRLTRPGSQLAGNHRTPIAALRAVVAIAQ